MFTKNSGIFSGQKYPTMGVMLMGVRGHALASQVQKR
jgi:hypothetical protein